MVADSGPREMRSPKIKIAVVRALRLPVKASAGEDPKHRACFSCHNQRVPVVASIQIFAHVRMSSPGFRVEYVPAQSRRPLFHPQQFDLEVQG
jgi:hypothetical protein